VFFKQTQLAEANRRGIFSEDFDVDAEVAATKGEVPVQGITSVGLREPPRALTQHCDALLPKAGIAMDSSATVMKKIVPSACGPRFNSGNSRPTPAAC
jgi:hypothetical protein